jgi:hypothetical protein
MLFLHLTFDDLITLIKVGENDTLIMKICIMWHSPFPQHLFSLKLKHSTEYFP